MMMLATFPSLTKAVRVCCRCSEIPHYDSADPRILAAVIYLFDRSHSGTSFYRHRTTGYERIREDNAQNYKIALNHNMKTLGPPAREIQTAAMPYLKGSTRLILPSTGLSSIPAMRCTQPILMAASLTGRKMSTGDLRLLH